MELVYLWVEEYKNIRNQGFNFSPRFECKYDGENLTITENKDYVSIFPENINITAIVGENGSGKSSLLKLFFLLIYCKKYESMDLTNPENSNNSSSIIKTVKNIYINKNIFLIFAQKKSDDSIEYKKISLLHTLKECYKKTYPLPLIKDGEEINKMKNCTLSYEEINPKDLDFFSIHFNYMLDTFYDSKQDEWIKDIYHKSDGYKTSLLLEPYKNNNDRQLIDLDIIEYLNNQNMLRFYSIFDTDKRLIKFFKPNKISLEIAQINSGNIENLTDEEFTCLNKCTKFLANKFYKIHEDNNIFLSLRENKKEKICKIFEEIEKLYVNKEYDSITYLYIALKVLSSSKELFNTDEYTKIKSWATELADENNLINFINLINLNNLINQDAPNYEVRKIRICIEFINKKIYEEHSFIDNLNKTIEIASVKTILEFIPPWINVEWFENDKSIKSLSSGEKSFFTFIINLMYQIQNINDKPEYSSINLFLDETELGLHPNWQRQYLSNILKAIEQINKKQINIFFASHSPFILSDIPKGNVIFLDKFDDNSKEKYPSLNTKNLENGNCINVSKHMELKTFGANIHTLLSDGFFMSDGLMAEFAKSKITEILDFLNDKKELETIQKEQIKPIIESIGENFLRNKLLDLYRNKFIKDEKEKEKQILKNRINELQRQYDELDK